MTKQAALYKFFSSFGIPAYPDTAVPDEGSPEWVGYPFLTYEVITGHWGGGIVSLAVQLFYNTESEAIPNSKAGEIEKTLGLGGVALPCDGGMIWLNAGSPFCQNFLDDENKSLKRRYILVDAEYLTV